ncbi:MAG: AbrB/MazE/SpoVT family DNA-binding domain-containing protein [Oscillospiraceae bacterium]|nr:AbrB/MazE/SpoVT family DNA-binding domain-containing protein [Oscillospiraceae bacterium]
MDMIKSKKLTANCAVSIPKEMRLYKGWEGKMGIDLVAVPEGILIRPHQKVCRFCGSCENIRTVKNVDVCEICGAAIKEDPECQK